MMNIKKYFLLLTGCASAWSVWAGAAFLNAYDVMPLMNNELNGTARFVAVGGAMGALGGDASTVSYNPAGIGIYRSSEITASLNVHWDNATMVNAPTQQFVTANLANASYIGTWNFNREKGLVSFNFGAGYNRLRSFDRNLCYRGDKDHSVSDLFAAAANGFTQNELRSYDSNASWRAVNAYKTYLIDPISEGGTEYTSYYDKIGQGRTSDDNWIHERGFVNEFSISFGGNVSNIFYFGMSFNCDYSEYLMEQCFRETMNNGSYSESNNFFRYYATAFTYKVGFIVRPVNWLRIGAAYHTPSWYGVRSYNAGNMNSQVGGLYYAAGSNTEYYEYANLTAPMKALGSIGFVLGKFGFIGFDYQYSYNRGAYISSSNREPYTPTINQIQNEFLDQHWFRLGMEIKPVEDLSLRLGGGYMTPGMKSTMSRIYVSNETRTDTNYYNDKGSYNVTAGLGYRFGRHSLDLAYCWQVNNADHYTYNAEAYQLGYSLEPVNIRNVRNQLIISYAVRF